MTKTKRSSRQLGSGRILIAAYAVLALAATGRASFELLTKFDQAPIPYTLSTLSALVYILATVALASSGQTWRKIAWSTVLFELVGVLAIGTLSFLYPALFTYAGKSVKTVWSFFGAGYGYIPLLLPILGIMWLRSRNSTKEPK